MGQLALWGGVSYASQMHVSKFSEETQWSGKQNNCFQKQNAILYNPHLSLKWFYSHCLVHIA